MSKSIFVSHVFEDFEYIKNLKKWESKSYLPGYTFTFDVADIRGRGEEAIKRHLDTKLRGIYALLVFVGQDTHSHEWIRFEVKKARKYNKKICCLRIPNSTGGIPSYLQGEKILPFDPKALLSNLRS